MWKCMICGCDNLGAVCRDCGQPQTADFVAARTLCPVPEADREYARQRAKFYQGNSSREAELEAFRTRNQELLKRVRKLQQENETLRQENKALQEKVQRMRQKEEKLLRENETLRKERKPAEPPRKEAPVQALTGRWKENCLKGDSIKLLVPSNGLFYGTLPRKEINSITFLPSVAALPPETPGGQTVDVSKENNQKVFLRVILQNGNWNAYFAAEGGIDGQYACDTMFQECINLTEIHFNGCFHTDGVTSLACAFANCSRLTALDLSGWNTDYVRNMSRMFINCTSLTKVDFTGIHTALVEDMSYMFFNCQGLTELDLSGFETSQVRSMWAMFGECRNLQALDISGFNTKRTVDMKAMFLRCKSLREIDISHFDKKTKCDKTGMFSGCKAKVIR